MDGFGVMVVIVKVMKSNELNVVGGYVKCLLLGWLCWFFGFLLFLFVGLVVEISFVLELLLVGVLVFILLFIGVVLFIVDDLVLVVVDVIGEDVFLIIELLVGCVLLIWFCWVVILCVLVLYLCLCLIYL